MNIIVLVKQVPDMDTVKFDQEKGTVDRSSAGKEMNPFDLNALEMAVEIKDRIGAKVTAISMGPPSAEEVLREAISRGADEGVLLSDKFFGGADVKATSRTLAAGIKAVGNADLIIGGLQTVDGDTGQVIPEIAGYLNLPHVYSITKLVDANEDEIVVETDLWDSNFVKKAKYPAVLAVTKEVNSPRMASFSSKMKAKKAVIQALTLEDLPDLSRNDVGIKGSPTFVKKIVVPKAVSRQGRKIKEEAPVAAKEIAGILKDKKFLEV